MKALTQFVYVVAALLTSGALLGQSGETLPRFGSYEALSIEREIIRGVRHADDGKIWLMLNPAYKEREIQLKISAQKGAAYRKWFTGDEVLISPAGQGKAANEWTDWIRTESRYIEYWMDGRLILHLRRTD